METDGKKFDSDRASVASPALIAAAFAIRKTALADVDPITGDEAVSGETL